MMSILFIAYVRYFFAYLIVISFRYTPRQGVGMVSGSFLYMRVLCVPFSACLAALRTDTRRGDGRSGGGRGNVSQQRKFSKRLDNLTYVMYLIYKITFRRV